MSEALGIHYVMRMRHIVTCVLPGSALFSHVISYTSRLLKKKKVSENKNVCFDSR